LRLSAPRLRSRKKQPNPLLRLLRERRLAATGEKVMTATTAAKATKTVTMRTMARVTKTKKHEMKKKRKRKRKAKRLV
jgi:transcription initiation factor IIE alpha subunit